MGDTPHELRAEFPDKVERLHALKVSNAEAARLMDVYHDINREIHCIEIDITPASDKTLENLKKKRLMLKDQIAAML
jgi:uncharacterized protein